MSESALRPAIYVVIPAFDEERSIGKVVSAIPRELVTEIIVVNNASADGTAEAARGAGATVLDEPGRGYGAACLKGISYCEKALPYPEIIVFLDGDYSDFPEEMRALVQPIIDGSSDLVIGARSRAKRERGSMTVQQVFGNWLATNLLRLFFQANFTDLGPFRAIRFASLRSLNMTDRSYGWTVEMQVKAAKKRIRFMEIPVSYRKRIGTSKVSGTLKGTVLAGYKILYTIFKYI